MGRKEKIADKTAIPIYKEMDDSEKAIRGEVLSIVASVEAVMIPMLKSFLVVSKATDNLTEGFNAPLGTFSAQIAIARSLGLVTEEEFYDLNLLRAIRNDYAHKVAIKSSDPTFSDRCRNFKSVELDDPEGEWIKNFVQVAKALCFRLVMRVPTIATIRLAEQQFEDGS